MKENLHFLTAANSHSLKKKKKKDTLLYPQDGGLLVDLCRIKQCLVF